MDDKPPPNPTNSKSQYNADKQTEAGAGAAGITNQEFRQNHPQPQATRPPPMPHELTAEWTVRAQLRFARAGETVRKDFSTNDPINPVRVVYKWTTLDADGAEVPQHSQHQDDDEKHSNVFKRNSSRSSGYSHDPAKESFRSTTSSTTGFGGGDSAFSGSNTSHHRARAEGNSTESNKPYYGTRCRSTCNIIVSAVADFLPPPGSNGDGADVDGGAGGEEGQHHMRRQFVREEEPDPFVFNTTACYTVLPEKSFDEDSCPQTPVSKTGKILNLKDAVCQTSDTETKYFEEYEHKRFKQSHSPLERRDSRRSYDHRRATAEALLQAPNRYGSGAHEGNTFMPSYLSSPTNPQAFKSASMPRIPSTEGEDVSMGANFGPLGSLPAFMASNKTMQSGTDGQKKPRTVHIDVYCTGSEDEDHADAESSSESDDNRRHDQESNSTFQTVLDNEQMRLRHQRMSGGALPRRLATNQQQPHQQHHPHQQHPKFSSEQNSSSRPSDPASPLISGDLQLGHGITKSSTTEEVNESKHILFRKHIGDQRAIKLANLRQKYLRQSSEDVASLGYPSSTRSTVLDNTCSSMSSVLAGHDVTDSHWRETAEDNEDYSLTKSESFEYENALDRLRIRQMERLWSRSHSKEEEATQQNQQMSHQTHHQHPHAGPHLQTIAENNNNNHRSLQRDDTLPSESDFNSETDHFYSYPLQTMQHQPQPRTNSPAFQQTQHFAKNRPGFLHFFGPQNENQLHPPPPPPDQPMSAPIEGSLLYPNYQPSLQRWKSETRENLSTSGTPALTPTELSRHTSPQPPSFQRSGSEAPPSTTSASTFPTATPTPARRLDLYQTYRQSPAMSEASTGLPPPGYSSEYLDKASKFGKVVAARKPGHHVGPTKNPNCSCESCQRWLAERFQVRGRAFSLGESPVLRKTK
ncbi:uncharacterized protein LOC105262075 isoform X2 [Musca domestica]|uniref:Uncharacterized protein LOC105262075 isoform X2 n=1 Tax=Musca domestica TaxID=7370 RepID=A0A1I8NKU2_MUSDO|nr:uncharacterized protein LOC105262075 isoform X2 [Musca domestica]